MDGAVIHPHARRMGAVVVVFFLGGGKGRVVNRGGRGRPDRPVQCPSRRPVDAYGERE